MAIQGSEPTYNLSTSLEPPHPPGAAMLESEFDGVNTRQLTQLQLIWIRFRRHRLAMIGSGILLFMALMAIFAPIISPENIYNPNSANIFGAADKAPTFADGLRYIFGADFNGHSICAQIIYGARFSLLIGFVSSFLATLIGASIGAVAGFFGGVIDTILMRIVDIFLTLPFFPVLLVSASLFGHGQLTVFLVILIFAFFGWAYIARLTRAQFLSLRTLEFVEAAKAVGVSNTRTIFRHLLPNAVRPLVVATTLAVANFIVLEAAIDFLGIGLQYPDTSWGSVLAFAEEDPQGLAAAWWVTVFPGLFLVATIVAVNFVGDGLSDALDVRGK